MDIEIISEFEKFAHYRSVWNQLVESSGFNSVFGTFEWFSCFIKSFGLKNKLNLILIRDGNELAGVLPFYRERTTIYKIPSNVMKSITNVHSPKFDVIVKPGYQNHVLEALELSRRYYAWDFVQLDNLPGHAFLVQQTKAIGHRSVRVRSVEVRRSPHLVIDCDWEQFWETRIAKSLRNDVRRLERQATENLGLRFERKSGESLQPEDVEEAFRIEDSGWKRRRGSSILRDARVREFYSELATEMNKRGCFELFFLLLGDKRCAFEYLLRYGRYAAPPKIGYDEEFKRYSPGNILRKYILECLFNEGFEKYDLLGAADSYKLRWTNGQDLLNSVYVFNGNLKSRILEFLLFDSPELARRLRIREFLHKRQSRLK